MNVQLQRLEEQERNLFTRRDDAENTVDKIVGRELSPLEFLQIRQAIGLFEDCEDRISAVQERMNAMEAN